MHQATTDAGKDNLGGQFWEIGFGADGFRTFAGFCRTTPTAASTCQNWGVGGDAGHAQHELRAGGARTRGDRMCEGLGLVIGQIAFVEGKVDRSPFELETFSERGKPALLEEAVEFERNLVPESASWIDRSRWRLRVGRVVRASMRRGRYTDADRRP